ncbi:uncharacterized protein SPPG_02227 [Spizellomyces punctatus DAOM BR117]|uniref:Uncharacterized protein n=1 Tax=Spizellomyces punctatus (strain DAOM BR117) TaxID=645134 RepID=A0A0L0HP36_SPIPD|nr:uncharacterized protein SPPG_02227 [Spizellomyces punctatus DAOM BR117]KND03166.1 hypothetical protein SPPG_02227 [Spizellomyces punctatus DAOM BR117]|eukprot:XP_016611205.1 hypothetical protein SPPG_02227 [Spizellomyces punctatus DAOM BR117]
METEVVAQAIVEAPVLHADFGRQSPMVIGDDGEQQVATDNVPASGGEVNITSHSMAPEAPVVKKGESKEESDPQGQGGDETVQTKLDASNNRGPEGNFKTQRRTPKAKNSKLKPAVGLKSESHSKTISPSKAADGPSNTEEDANMDKTIGHYEAELRSLEEKEANEAKRTKAKHSDTFAYRHFHMVHPTCNKLLGRRWDMAKRKIHLQRLAKAKSSIDTSPPKEYPHLQHKLKKLQMQEERRAQIEHDNKILVDKMSSIMKLEKKVFGQHPSPLRFAHSLNANRRQREVKKVNQDNMAILERLEGRESFYKHEDQVKSRHQTIGYLCNIAAYPDRFIRLEEQYDRCAKDSVTERHEAPVATERIQQLEKDWTSGPSPTSGRSSVNNHHVRFRKGPEGAGKHHRKKRAQTPKIGIAAVDAKLLGKEAQFGGPPPLPGIPVASSSEVPMRESSALAPLDVGEKATNLEDSVALSVE